MGIPQCYSRDLPERCMRLIDCLSDQVRHIEMPGEECLGPLSTTFLLALATPAILFPLERINAVRNREGEAYINERPLDGSLTSKIDNAFKGKLQGAPFFEEGVWRFAKAPFNGDNLSTSFPSDLESGLNSPQSIQDAADMQGDQWASCIRNSLAHGGVIYLDSSGRQSFGSRVACLAFVSAKYPEQSCSRSRSAPERINALRISENDFREFLRSWTDWLTNTGLSQALAA